ncbi:MAG TPA: hypothetical protein ENI51_02060 [Candidatus Atribacteria bacterium]|nr:hypothetical protein [Candidatus Atribacteria bacterium]
MKTSNFRKNGYHPLAVAISRTVPKWYKGRRYLKLAPPWWLIKIKNPQKFIEFYYRYVLNRLDPNTVYAELGQDAILLCWEEPGEFCHRRIVAQWLEEKLNIKIPEL